MRLLTLFSLALIIPVKFLTAQSATPPNPPSAHISGKILDSAEHSSPANASVLLLRQSDSMLIKFVRTDKTGAFELNTIPKGKYLLLITHPGYADYVDDLDIKDSSLLTLPPIPMLSKSKLLEAVVVNGAPAIRMKGDTLEFKADSFMTRPGATVEDLLKKLPGFQVDRNGKITAEGKTISKVLVDGEEFFGDDPTLVTQNLHADMVDKVQLYDKKSDQTNFTGIDDGQRTKTVNLKLKANKRDGYFGKLSGSVGTDKFYDGQAMFNKFHNKEKMAGFVILSNTGKTGLDWSERDRFGQSFADNVDVDQNTGEVSFNGGSGTFGDWSGRYEGQGLPTVKTAGVHYNNKWDNDKQNFNTNYKYLDLRVVDTSNTRSQYILPDTSYYTNSRQASNNTISRHNFDGSYELKSDSTSSIKLDMDGGTDHKNDQSNSSSEFLAKDSSLVNRNSQSQTAYSDGGELNGNLLWRKKLSKPHRTLSVDVRENYRNNTSSGYLLSNTSFYTGGIFSHDSTIDQFKQNHSDNFLLNGKALYTEPISSHSFLGINYTLTVDNSHSDQNSYNKGPGAKYNLLDSLYSSNYAFNTLSQGGGLSYTYIDGKFRISLSNNIGLATYKQKDLYADTLMRRHFVNWYPHASMTYSFSNSRHASFYYNGNSSPPALYQIQPTHSNQDPLNISIGNPSLKPSFNNNIALSYDDYKQLSERYLYIGINGSFNPNAVVSNTVVDPSTGKSTNQFINVNGNYNFSLNGDYRIKWKGPGLNVDFNGGGNYNNNVSMVNNVRNTTRNGNYNLGVSLGKWQEKKFVVNIGPSATYTDSRSTINTAAPTQYWTYNFSVDFGLFLPWKLDFYASDVSTIRQKTPVFTTNNNVNIVNLSLEKKLLKNDVLHIKVAVNDLLKQNIGFNRSVNSNFISQSTNTTIQRYGMLSVIWNFSKMNDKK